MNRVLKYPIPLEDHFSLTLPRRAKILSFQTQHDQPQVWALVNPEESRIEDRQFRLAGTGHAIEEREDDLHYIGSCQMMGGALVWHLFEIIRF
jgi:3-phenylpropionate/cinnamic acid dioxygenase small subunit